MYMRTAFNDDLLLFLIMHHREKKVHRVDQVQQASRDRREMPAVLGLQDNQEKRECQELMDNQESKEILEHR